MTLYIGWLHKYDIVYQVSIGNISVEEYVTSIQQLGQLFATSPAGQLAHLIMDCEKLTALPNLKEMRVPEVADVDKWIMYINMNNALFKMMTSISNQQMKVPTRMCKDYDEAYNVLQRVDPNLSDVAQPSLEEIEWCVCVEGTDVMPVKETSLVMMKA